MGLIDTMPPWHSSIKPQPVYETADVQAFWDVPVHGEYQELRANRVDARIVNNKEKATSKELVYNSNLGFRATYFAYNFINCRNKTMIFHIQQGVNLFFDFCQ